MGKPTKTIEEKLQTKLTKFSSEDRVTVTKKTLKVDNRILFKYSKEFVSYTKIRYFPSKKEDIAEEDFSVTILLDHKSLKLISNYNPPRGARVVIDQFRKAGLDLENITIGGTENKVERKTLFITISLYDTFVSINTEEGKDRIVRVRNRIAPFLKNKYDIEVEDDSADRDYGLLLEEVLASKSITQNDIAALTKELDSGEVNDYVIETRRLNGEGSDKVL